jgi:N-acetyl sugar amidotransferase
MDDSDIEIYFNEEGYCNHCVNYVENILPFLKKNNTKKLEEIVRKIKKKGKNNKYDCLIGVSGGTDSSYLVYLAKKYELRPLLLHVDTGWNSEIAISNLQKLQNIFGFQYETYSVDTDKLRKAQLAFLRASVPEIETPTDNALLAILYKVADRYNVKYILLACNFVSEAILPKTWHYNVKDLKYYKYILKNFGNDISLKDLPIISFKTEFYYKFIKRIKFLYPLNYINYNPIEARKILDQFGIKYYNQKHNESISTGFVQRYILPKKFGIDYRKATLSNKICNGIITREEALNILSKNIYEEDNIEQQINEYCKIMQLSREEFNAIMNQPPKYYFNYPNNEKILNTLYNIYYFITRGFNYKKYSQ